MEREEKAERLSHLWMGTNLNYDGLKEAVESIRGTKKKVLDYKEIKNDWKRLAAFMQGK